MSIGNPNPSRACFLGPTGAAEVPSTSGLTPSNPWLIWDSLSPCRVSYYHSRAPIPFDYGIDFLQRQRDILRTHVAELRKYAAVLRKYVAAAKEKLAPFKNFIVRAFDLSKKFAKSVWHKGFLPFLGYHHILMILIAVAIILLCKSLSHTRPLYVLTQASSSACRMLQHLAAHSGHLPH